MYCFNNTYSNFTNQNLRWMDQNSISIKNICSENYHTIVDPFFEFPYRVNYQDLNSWQTIAVWLHKNVDKIPNETKIRILLDSAHFLTQNVKSFKILLNIWNFLKLENCSEVLIIGIFKIADTLQLLNCQRNITLNILDHMIEVIDRFRNVVLNSNQVIDRLLANLDERVQLQIFSIMAEVEDNLTNLPLTAYEVCFVFYDFIYYIFLLFVFYLCITFIFLYL